MSLIKSHSANAAAPRWRPETPPDRLPVAAVVDDPMAAERAALMAQVAGLAAERDLAARRLIELEAERVEAVAVARAAGREAGLAEAASRAEEALARLERSLEGGLAQLAADAAALETLAVQVARAALAKIFADPAGPVRPDPGQLVEAAIRRQLADVEAEMLVRVEVSACDFPDPERLAQLSKALGRGRVQVLANPALTSGDSRLKLKLGEVEIGLPQQWRRLSAVLERHIASLVDAG
jgi:flagellar biosynthesis/type III secretory pathway protein FliH